MGVGNTHCTGHKVKLTFRAHWVQFLTLKWSLVLVSFFFVFSFTLSLTVMATKEAPVHWMLCSLVSYYLGK